MAGLKGAGDGVMMELDAIVDAEDRSRWCSSEAAAEWRAPDSGMEPDPRGLLAQAQNVSGTMTRGDCCDVRLLRQ